MKCNHNISHGSAVISIYEVKTEPELGWSPIGRIREKYMHTHVNLHLPWYVGKGHS